MLPPADKSQAALRVQAEALWKSAAPLANAAFISFAFFIWILISCTGDSKGHGDKDGAEFLHTTSPSQLRCWWVNQNGCSLTVFAVMPTNDTNTRACWKWCLHYRRDSSQLTRRPSYGAMPNQLNPLGCLTNMRLQTVALSSSEKTPNVFSFKS